MIPNRKPLRIALTLAFAAACYDPVHQDDVASLGDEAPGVPEGPFHRPGQHCTTCHGDQGPGKPEFSIAGTVYGTKGKFDALVDATITVTDAKGSTAVLMSNTVGNFYVDKKQWNPIFPVHVMLQANGVLRTMTSAIGRDGGCAACHRGTGDSHYQSAIYLRDK